MPSLPSPSPPQPSTLPRPSTFDFLPPLHALLSRLLAPPNHQGQAQAQNPTQPPLSPKDLATEAAAVKIKIQAARLAVEALPDIERAVEEQEDEVRELEERIEGQREVLRGVVQAARGRG